MSLIEYISLPPVRRPRCRLDLAALVTSTIAGAMVALQCEPGSALQRQCLRAVERLWQRREAIARVLGPAPWPPSAQACAAGLRWVVQRASDDPAVRLELMQLGEQLLVPRRAQLLRRHSAGGLAAQPDAALIESVQPGEWFRIYLHDQWATARLTWRSDNGRYFMFSSRLAGRSHSLSRGALERMISQGQLKPLARGPGSARSAARAS